MSRLIDKNRIIRTKELSIASSLDRGQTRNITKNTRPTGFATRQCSQFKKKDIINENNEDNK